MVGRAQGHKHLVNQRFEGRHARPIPTARGSIMSINLARSVSAAFMAAVVCFDVLQLEPKTTTPPMTAAISQQDVADFVVILRNGRPVGSGDQSLIGSYQLR
jgi:hypothetical protein